MIHPSPLSALPLSLALLLGPALAGGGGAVGGSVAAPAGQDVKGTVVIACAPGPQGCDVQKSRTVTVAASGALGKFSVTGLGPGEYRLLAWKDLDGDGEIGPGDLLAVLGGDDPLPVKAGATNVALRLGVVPAATQAAQKPVAQKPAAPLPKLKGEPGYVVGRVVDSAGRPLANATVTVDPAVNGYLQSMGSVQTGADGTYRVRVARGYDWKASAQADLVFAGRRYCAPAAPDGAAGFFEGGESAVRDFRLNLGFASLNLRHEFRVEFDPARRPRFIGGTGVVNRLQVRLDPIGPLADGSAGRPIDLVIESFSGQPDAFGVERVPLGRYRLTAAFVEANGARTPLEVANDFTDRAFRPSAELTFEKTGTTCSAWTDVTFRFPQ